MQRFSYKVAIDPLQRCQALVVYHQADVRVPSCGDVHIMSCCIRKSLLNYIREWILKLHTHISISGYNLTTISAYNMT